MTKSTQLATSGGQTLAVSPEVAEFYKKNAEIGSENLSMSLPQLKVTESNSKNEETDGQHAKSGTFYYSPTKESFETVRVSIMTISRGFYALDNSTTPKPKFTQLVGGMMLDTMQPFIMFVSGTRLQNMWDFGKEIKPFAKHKVSPVPMFGFEVTLSLKEIESNYGKNHVVEYKISRNKEGQIQLLADMDVVNHIRASVDSLESMFEDFITQKEVDKNTGELLKNSVITVNDVEEAGLMDVEPTQEEIKNSEDISDDVPF